MMNVSKIIRDYKVLNIPLDMIARKNKVSLAFVLRVLHYVSVKRKQDIKDCKKILKEIENENIK